MERLLQNHRVCHKEIGTEMKLSRNGQFLQTAFQGGKFGLCLFACFFGCFFLGSSLCFVISSAEFDRKHGAAAPFRLEYTARSKILLIHLLVMFK